MLKGMSRIRGIEAKVQKEVLQTCSYEINNESIKNKNEVNTSKSTEDIESICSKSEHQINELLLKLPKLGKIFEVHRKIGEGTFSSVYLGSLRHHAGLPSYDKRWFAIKHLVPTAHPSRIEHELKCLQDIGGKNNVIGVELCLRNLDTIVFIMPYIPHRKFSEYVGEMDASELRSYMRALMVALQHVHSFGVIHRDVKPSNFLYDKLRKKYLLVDFGLAQRLCPPPDETVAPSSPPGPPPAHASNTRKRLRNEEDSSPGAKRLALDLSLRSKAIGRDSSTVASISPKRTPATNARAAPITAGVSPCVCAGAGGVCSWCVSRAAPRAARAGTQGFRPPEVLLKYPHQTTAVDTWAAGVVLLSVLAARYPFFRAADDGAALAELADLLGTQPLQRAAAALGRRMVTSTPRRGLCLRKLCAKLRGVPPSPRSADDGGPCAYCLQPRRLCICRDDRFKAEAVRPGLTVAGFPDAAFSLAAQLLDPDPRSRLSAAAALHHPFLREL